MELFELRKCRVEFFLIFKPSIAIVKDGILKTMVEEVSHRIYDTTSYIISAL